MFLLSERERESLSLTHRSVKREREEKRGKKKKRGVSGERREKGERERKVCFFCFKFV